MIRVSFLRETVELQSPMSVEEASAALAAITEAGGDSNGDFDGVHHFVGRVYDDSFRLRRKSPNFPWLTPDVVGVLNPGDDGTCWVKMKILPRRAAVRSVVGVTLISMVVLAIFLYEFFFYTIVSRGQESSILFVLIVIYFIAGLFHGVHKYKVERARTTLISLFEGSADGASAVSDDRSAKAV